MNMMPQQPMAPMLPPMPSPEQIERAQAIMDAVSWEQIEPILRTDERRNYNIDIETDSTAFQDEEAEKAGRIECVTAITAMLEKGVPAIQANPKLAKLMKELGMFTLGAFKIGRTLEETFEETFDDLANVQPQPNPEQQKLEMEAKAKQAEFQLKQEDRKQDMVFKEKERQLKERGMMAELAFKEKELGFKEQELGMKQQDAELNRQAQAEDRMFQREQQQFDRQAKQEDMAFNRQDRAMKSEDMAYRRAMDAESMKGPDGKTARDSVMASVESLVQQVSQAVGQISEKQMMIVQAIQGLAAQQEETSEAVTAVVRRMTAPKRVVRDGAGRASGVEIGENEGDLRSLLERLGKGGQITRGANGRVEAYA